MSVDPTPPTVATARAGPAVPAALAAALGRIDLIGLSQLDMHGGWCCRAARSALLGRFLPSDDIGATLAAVPAVVPWTPTRWPHWWCELDATGPRGDCGVHADLAAAILGACGLTHVRGRAALAPPSQVTAHWTATWREADVADDWLGTTAVHHEVLRIGDRWWDPSGASWFDGAGSNLSSGRVLAVREDAGTWQIWPSAASWLESASGSAHR